MIGFRGVSGLRVFLLAAAALSIAGCASTAERNPDEERRQKLVDTNVQLAAGYLQQGQMDAAKEKLDKALERSSDDPQANNVMALLQWRLRNYDAAEKHFQRALGSKNSGINADVQHNYGAFLCDRNRVDEALTWFERAIANPQYPTPELANLNAGLCLLKKPDRAAAERYVRQALQRSPALAPALLTMARLSYESGNALSARGFMERYAKAGPETAESLWLGVRVERALGDRNAEASYALRLKGRFPDAPETQEYLRSISKARP
jgi:type IV pilus assembly protein PilF